ncbi:MAG: hypothetical protein WD572_04960 [Gammaproteobacteria bacterium]
MKKQGHYSPEVRERAVRMVHEQESAHSSRWAAWMITHQLMKADGLTQSFEQPRGDYDDKARH